MEKQININENIKVRLTDQGLQRLSKVNRSGYSYYFDEFGYLNIQIYELMEIFGPNMFGNSFFEGGYIIISDEDLKDYETESKRR